MLLCAALMVAAVPDLRERVTSITDVGSATSVDGGDPDADQSIRARWTETRAAALAFSENALIGLGPQNFPLHYQEYARRIGTGIHTRVRFGATRGDVPQREAHNLFVGIAADLGLIGLVLFLAILWTAMSRLARLQRRAARIDPEIANYAGGFLLALVTYVITGVFLTLAFERYLWLLVALASATSVVGIRILRLHAAAEPRA
jgi:putative inorganic carbon (HCO3(-)) transporter